MLQQRKTLLTQPPHKLTGYITAKNHSPVQLPAGTTYTDRIQSLSQTTHASCNTLRMSVNASKTLPPRL